MNVWRSNFIIHIDDTIYWRIISSREGKYNETSIYISEHDTIEPRSE